MDLPERQDHRAAERCLSSVAATGLAMLWTEVREKWPDQWLIIEALEAHTEGDRRHLDRIAVVETCPDGQAAFQRHRLLHRQYPQRELLFVHTRRPDLDIEVRRWVGIWAADEVAPAR